MTCEQCANLLPLYPLGLLEAAELEQVRAHLASGCPRCAAELAQHQETLALLPAALPDAPAPGPAVRARLLQRLQTQSQLGSANGPPARGKLRPLAVAAAIAAPIASALLVWSVMAPRQKELTTQLAEQRDTIEHLEGRLREAGRTESMLASAERRLFTLAGTESQPAATASVLWDVAARQWRVDARGLKPLPPGRAYELWFITTDDRKLPAGTFTPDPAGRAVHFTPVPLPPDQIALAAITDEPAAGAPQPTGPIHLAGKVSVQ